VLGLSREVLEWYLESYAAEKQDPGEWNTEGLHLALKETFGIDVPVAELHRMGRAEMAEHLQKAIETRYAEKERAVGPELMLFHQRMIMLQIVDGQWKDHLYSLDHLKEGIGLRGYGQRDPLVEYKKESFTMFQALMDRIDEEILRWIFLYQPVAGGGPEIADDDGSGGPAPAPASRPAGSASAARVREPEMAMAGAKAIARNLSFNDPTAAPSAFARAQPKEAEGGSDEVQTIRREGKKVGRNDPCPAAAARSTRSAMGAADPETREGC
jgi:preprotein translocase subunit SecA